MTLDSDNNPEYTYLLINDNQAKKLAANIGLVLSAKIFICDKS